jgi:RNA polymerase sigma factor (sigma-70 family)
MKMDKEKIVIDYLPLVRSIAAQYSTGKIEIDDLIQEGMIGLLQAADKFDPDRETQFSTYATYWIKKYILEAVEKEIKNTFNMTEMDVEKSADENKNLMQEKWKELSLPQNMPEAEKIILKLIYENQLTLNEIAARLEMPREKVRQIKEKALRRMRAHKKNSNKKL